MGLRRKQASPAMSQPVRFYKLVALSFLFPTIALLGMIIFMSSKRATIVITTKESPVDVESLVSVEKDGDMIGSVLATTTVSLARGFSPTGSKTEPGIARGTVTLHNDGNVAQPLVATTRLLTPDSVLFRLKDRVVVPANGTIQAEVYADKEGASGDVGAIDKFTIPGLRAEKQKIVYGSSSSGMTGGVHTIGVLSASDVKKAEAQLLAELEKLGKETLQKKFSDKKAVYKVVQHTINNEAPIGEEVGEFTLSGKATILAVFYNPTKVQEYARAQLLKRVVDDVTVLRGADGNATVQLKEYDLRDGVAMLTIYHSAVERLNADSKQLEKMLFFGKSKEEVRRHVLTLDHVYSVDVKFRPMWVRSIPFVPEHVQVIVKTVQ